MSGSEEKDHTKSKGLSAVIYKISKKGSHLYEPVKSVPSAFLIVLLGVYLLLGYFTQLVEDNMPNVVTDSSVTRDNSDTFSEEAAFGYLLRIVGDEPRVAGAEYHLKKTADLKALIDGIAADANQVVRTDWQLASGDYFHNSSASFFNVYQNVSNVIAVLEGESGFNPDGTTRNSLLVNCHYDSVPFALGASDNAVFCSIMVEILKRLSRRKEKLKLNVVFLFNGAEENGLQASHGFLQHPWAKGVTTVVNLDAAGMNGKPTIFQVTDPRVLNAYRRSVRMPNAQGLAQFLFSSGLVPSDTDFRIWREFGNIYGIDMAFVKWAHVYHTRNDRPDNLQAGVLQAAGDMLLAVLAEVADDDMEDRIEPQAAMYFDYLNIFMISSSFAIAYVLDVVVVLLALSSVAYYVWLVGARWSTVHKLLYSCLGRVVAMLAGIVLVAIFTPIMVATTVQMRYMTHLWLVVPLYWLPYTITAVAVSQAYDAWTLKRTGLSRSLRSLQAQSATRVLLCVSLAALMCVPSASSLRYMVSAPLFIMSLMSLVSLTALRYVTLKAWQQLSLEVVLSLPASMFMLSLALRLNSQMLPIMSRSGGDTPDYTVAMLNVGLATLVCSTVSGLELLFSRRFLWYILGAVGSVCVVLMFIPFSPYDADGLSLQRHYWFHTEIMSFDASNSSTFRTSGIVVTKHDPYSTKRVLPSLGPVSVRTDLSTDCESQVYCGLPLFRTSFGKFLKDAMFIYTGPPAPFTPPVSVSLNQRSCNGNTCSYQFIFTGANHNLITLWTRANVTISSWSLSSPPRISYYHQDRPVYVIYHSKATYDGETMRFNLNVDFNVPSSLQSQPIVDVSFHSHKIHHPQDFTQEYNNTLQAMPEYFNIASFLSFRYNYVF